MTDAVKLFIPPLGFEFALAADWTFALHQEHRNAGLLGAAGLLQTLPNRANEEFWSLSDERKRVLWEASPWRLDDGQVPSGNFRFPDLQLPFTFRAGTRLKVDRIYIRQGQTGFDSVSFRAARWVTAPTDPLARASTKSKSLRFWAKLGDVNRILLVDSATETMAQ